MQTEKRCKGKLALFLFICFALIAVTYFQAIFAVPGKLILLEDKEYVYNFKNPFLVNIEIDKDNVLTLNHGDIKTSGSYLKLSDPISFNTKDKGTANLRLKIFGLIPLKTMKVDVIANKKLMACGNTIGVKLKLNGAMVVGISDVETADGRKLSPARDAGIKVGDIIVAVNGKELKSIDQLLDEIAKSKGKEIKIKYKRDDVSKEVALKPVRAPEDNKYRIGLWVRNTTAGIGTLTFYDPETGKFGALGHGITDIDTGTLVPVDEGEIIESNILTIKKGKAGIPGELKGVFVENANKLGTIFRNSDCGIFGTLDEQYVKSLNTRMYPIGLKQDIKEGKATILANISGNEVKEYEIEIQKVSRQSLSNTKGMVIKITDERLLAETGGIVQGMSGSPIIQDNKIIGAVTHVLVNDPTRGYGIFIENMIKDIMGNNSDNIKYEETKIAG